MKNYTLQRFVKLNLYLFGMYGLLTAAWFGVTGKFKEDVTGVVGEILINAAIFSLLFTIGLLLWYRRMEMRIPVKSISLKSLDQKLEEIGYERIPAKGKECVQVYKPRPPKASALAGRLFVQKSANFYHLQGPKMKLQSIKLDR